MKYYAWAEHCGGASVGHPCATGVYPDPADGWETAIEADSAESAQAEAERRFAESVQSAGPCDCSRRLSPGSERWWDSVAVTVSLTPYPDYTDPHAAAPDLLEAARNALGLLVTIAEDYGYDTSIGVVPELRAAIAKAEGAGPNDN